MKLLKKLIKKLSFGIQRKMLVLFSFLIIFSISFMSYFAVVLYGKKMENNSINASNRVISSLILNLDSYFDGLINITSLTTYNRYIQNYLIINERKQFNMNSDAIFPTSNDDTSNFQMSMEVLGNIINSRQDITSIYILNNNGVQLFKSSLANADSYFEYITQDWYQNSVSAQGRSVITGPHFPLYLKKGNSTVFSISRSIDSYDGLNKLGVVLIDTNLNIINNYCQSAKLNNGFIMILDNLGNIVYCPNDAFRSSAGSLQTSDEFSGQVLPVFGKSRTGNLKTNISGMQYQIVYSRMDMGNWTVAAVTPYNSIVSETTAIRNLILIAGFFCLILILVITYMFSRKITMPIITLKKNMDQADHGNLTISCPVKSNDEIGMLSTSFNHMLERIRNLMKQVVDEQEEKRKLELKALQHQINPHFLYNTLDSIIWMAESKDENIVPMTEALSKLFRISLSRGKELISLSDELDHVRNYLFIQSMRYLNKFDYEITAPQELLSCKTLKLILQPIVENSIYHGIKNMQGKGSIKINASEENEKLVIKIQDNGIGMDEEMLERLLNEPVGEKSSKGSGIGVHNVNERIKLYFGEQYGLRFESELDKGTTAYVYLPLLRN